MNFKKNEVQCPSCGFIKEIDSDIHNYDKTIQLHLTLIEVYEVAKHAYDHFGSFHSAHEGYALIREEIDELGEQIKKTDSQKNIEAMRTEAIQIAALALTFASEIEKIDNNKKKN